MSRRYPTFAFRLVLCWLCTALPSSAARPFFAFDNGLNDVASLDDKAALLKELGYDGIGWRPGRTDGMLAALDRHGLKMFSSYVVLHATDKECPVPGPVVAEIDALKGRDTIVWLAVNGKSTDEIVVPAVARITEIAARNGLRVALYPHSGFHTDTVASALRLVGKVRRPNLGVSFNLCHFLNQQDESELEATLRQAAPHLMLVSVNGADSGDTRRMGWDRLVRPLGEGSFDPAKLLGLLDEIGYRGPVSLQCFGTKEPARSHLGKSMRAWLALEARHNAAAANEAFSRSRRFVDGWLAHADPASGLIPRNLKESRDFWNGRDSAADNYSFMVLTAAMTDRPLLNGRMLEMLRAEARLTARKDRLVDDYSFSRKSWRRERFDLDATIFDSAEYVKDGLLPITEWLGPSPWSERMTGIVDDIWKNAAVETPSGPLPTRNFEVNGDLLQACSRLFWFTGERKYLEWAARIGDYYLLGNHHPTRDSDSLVLNDHACEMVNGLSELYFAASRAWPEKREAWRAPLHEMFDRILATAIDEHGMIHQEINPRAGTVRNRALTDNWGYNFDGFYTVWLVDGTAAYRDAVRRALSNLRDHCTGHVWQGGSADGYADSIEGAITLLNREPVDSGFEWVDSEIRTMWAKQRADGVIEGWHGDGNFARTSLMYALWKTQGVTIEPWRADVRFGAARRNGRLVVHLEADRPWTGRLVFDRPRHREILRLPVDYPRINQFPEWFTVERDRQYAVTAGTRGPARTVSGRELATGLPFSVPANGSLSVVVDAADAN